MIDHEVAVDRTVFEAVEHQRKRHVVFRRLVGEVKSHDYVRIVEIDASRISTGRVLFARVLYVDVIQVGSEIVFCASIDVQVSRNRMAAVTPKPGSL